MPGDLVDVANRVVARLERSDVEAVRVDLAPRLVGWDPGPWIVERWLPRLDDLAGPDRTMTGARRVSDVMARVVFVGSRGRAFVTVLFDDATKVGGLSIDEDERDGHFSVVVGCTKEQSANLEAFYRALARGPIGSGEGGAHRPRWRDPSRPAQIHLDVAVPDLDAAERAVLQRGARKLETFPGWRVYADPAGHPFCLYPGSTQPTESIGVLVRVVIDCAEPPVLARFWGALLEMPRQVDESPDRILIARDEPSLPMIALQRVADYRPPRWPDPKFPAQMHFDIGFDDRPRLERFALDLGATRLPPLGGSCPVYADPAGHPFCLCYKGE